MYQPSKTITVSIWHWSCHQLKKKARLSKLCSFTFLVYLPLWSRIRSSGFDITWSASEEFPRASNTAQGVMTHLSSSCISLVKNSQLAWTWPGRKGDQHPTYREEMLQEACCTKPWVEHVYVHMLCVYFVYGVQIVRYHLEKQLLHFSALSCCLSNHSHRGPNMNTINPTFFHSSVMPQI